MSELERIAREFARDNADVSPPPFPESEPVVSFVACDGYDVPVTRYVRHAPLMVSTLHRYRRHVHAARSDVGDAH